MANLFEQLYFGNPKDYCKEISEWTTRGGKLYIWGVGSVANGVINELEKRNIKIDGCFVNVPDYHLDARVAAKNIPIFQLENLLLEKVSFSVIVGHSHYELIDMLKKYDQIEHIWCLNGAARDDIEITKEFVCENISLLEEVYERLEDELSKRNMIAYLNAKLTKDDAWIFSEFKRNSTYFDNDIIKMGKEEVYLDLGAYDGESIKNFMEKCSDFKQILAVEVMPEACKKLLQKYGDHPKICVYNIGVSDHAGEERFYFNEQSTCIAQGEEGSIIPVTTVDALCANVYVSIIKICVGNTIVPLLVGAKGILSEYTPKLILTAGIDKRALIDYIPQIEALAGKKRYKYYLRFTNAMTECLVLYAIPR